MLACLARRTRCAPLGRRRKRPPPTKGDFPCRTSSCVRSPPPRSPSDSPRPRPRGRQSSEPIKIGFLTVRTGALAAGGKQMEEGIQLFLKERNYTIAGRKVELIIADTGGNPAGAKTKTQDLVERNKVHVIIGPLAAFEAIAIDDYIRQTKTPIVSCSAAAEDLTQRKPNPWFVRTRGELGQPNHAIGEYAAKDLKYKRIAIIADDFAYGHETAGAFQRVFEDNGGKVVQKHLHAAQRARLRRLHLADQDQRRRGVRGLRRRERLPLPARSTRSTA